MTESLVQKAVEVIKQRMSTGDLRPGERLSNTRLAKEIGISRTPVREALSHLASTGLVEQLPGIGAFVRIPDQAEIEELFEFREILECMAIRTVAKARNPAVVQQLFDNCRAMAELVEEIDAIGGQPTEAMFNREVELDQQFHTTIVSCTTNRWSRRTFDELQIIARIFLYKRQRQEREERPTDLYRRVLKEHSQIVEAIHRGDAEQATQRMAMHLRLYTQPEPDPTAGPDSGASATGLNADQLGFLRRLGGSESTKPG